MRGIFGNMFDLNRDGKLDHFERAMEFEFLEECEREENGYDDDAEEYDDEFEEEYTELELAGIDPEELEFMDDDERREILEEAGLDPDDYDF